MPNLQHTVHAIDLGYGRVKYSLGRANNGAAVLTRDFASISVQSSAAPLANAVIHQRDTHHVPVRQKTYEVGSEIALAIHGNHEGEVLDNDFALSDAYCARLYGALNYIHEHHRRSTIDVLVLGLPMTTYRQHSAALEAKFSGSHTINTKGTKLQISRCCVFPQPLGGYTTFLSSGAERFAAAGKPPTALIIDPGYNTVDWFVCRGMKANELRSSAVPRGMGVVMRAIADELKKSGNVGDVGVSELVRKIDESIRSGQPLRLFGKDFDIRQARLAGQAIIEEAVQAIKNSVGSGADIDVVVLVGGGADFYAQSVRDKFPHHETILLDSPAMANVTGFHLMGEQIMSSSLRTQAAAIA
jgi:plasmid segregation protein ParM